MRVFLDTNLLASAAATRGLRADVLREVLASHQLLTSAQVLSELRRVLRTKFDLDRDLIDDFIMVNAPRHGGCAAWAIAKRRNSRSGRFADFVELRFRRELMCW